MRRRYWRASALAGLLGLIISVGMIDSATAHHTPPRPVAIASVPNLAMHADALLARINLVDRHAEQLRRHRAGRDIEP